MPPTPVSQTQATANLQTGGLTGAGLTAAKNVLAGYYANQAKQSNTPATQPGVLSSQNIDTKNQQNIQAATTASASPKGQSTSPEGFVVSADGSYAEAPSNATQTTDPSTGQTYFTDASGLKYAMGSLAGKISSDPNIQSNYDQLNQLKSQMDSTGAAQIQNIKDMYSALIAKQEEINRGAEAGVSSLLIRGGSMQTASSSGILQSQIGWGIQQISDLVTKENSAVLDAQAAVEKNDMDMLDKMMAVAQKARDDRQAAAQKIAETVQAAQVQQFKDSTIGSLLSMGVTSPEDMLSHLKDQGITGITSKDITDTLANLRPDQKAIMDVLTTAENNGAPASVLQSIGKANSLNDAYTAAGLYGAGGTGIMGEYNAARAQGYNGTLMDYQAASAYKQAYASASAALAAKVATVETPQYQDKLEQQGRQVILKELSNRSGGLGLQDSKVNQAIHLTALLNQYKTTTTDIFGNTKTVYKVPPAQYEELAMGLANLVSPTGSTAEADRRTIMSKTAAGDIAGAIQYITGTPQPGSTTSIIQNLADSIDRQGTIAEQERGTYLNNMQNLLPSDLDPSRADALVKGSSLNSYTTYKQTGEMTGDPSTMTPAQLDQYSYNKIQVWSQDSKNAALLSDLAKQFPNMSNVDMAQKLGLIPPAP